MTEFRLLLTASQLRMARAAIKCSVEQVAEEAQIAPGTVRRLEKGDSPKSVTTSTLERLQRVYENHGVHFEPDDGRYGPGVRTRDQSSR